MKIEIEVRDPMVVQVGQTATTIEGLTELLCAVADPIPNRWYRFYKAESGQTMCQVEVRALE